MHLTQVTSTAGGFRRPGHSLGCLAASNLSQVHSPNIKFSMADIGLGAFSVFFTQSPSFLAHQKTVEQTKGRSNAQSLFHIEQIPSDNHIRETLDPVPPEKLFPLYDQVFQSLGQKGVLENYRAVHDTLPIALDGTWYNSSQKLSCQNCSCIEHKSGEKPTITARSPR